MGDIKGLLVRILSPVIWRNRIKSRFCSMQKTFETKEKIRENKKRYENDKALYCQLNKRENFTFKEEYECSILGEWDMQAGYPSSYFWQDLWGSQKIAEKMPERHFDIGSRIDGFISHLMLLKIPVTLIDIRPLDKKIPGVDFFQSDATELRGIKDNSIESLSALCSLEHFGLGRYGDSIDPEACYKAFKEIQRVVKPGGYIYISLPIGKERVCFNAHRVFDPTTIIHEFDACELEEYSVIDLEADPVVVRNCDVEKYRTTERGLDGLFCLRKI